MFFFLMIRRPPRSTRTAHSFPTRRSSDLLDVLRAAVLGPAHAAERGPRAADLVRVQRQAVVVLAGAQPLVLVGGAELHLAGEVQPGGAVGAGEKTVAGRRGDVAQARRGDAGQIGRASCRERVWTYWSYLVVA